MVDAASPPHRRASKPKQITADAAREKMLAKLQKAGAKGTLSLLPPKGGAGYEAALADLEREERIFVDRRKAKPRFYLWELRPAFPTAASVAQELSVFATGQF